MSRTVLITGANGFIGARLCASFAAEGDRVVAQVRAGSDLRSLTGLKIETRIGDVTAKASLPPLVADADVVIHNAGLVKASRQGDFTTVNVDGTRHLLAAAQESGRPIHFVLISSMAAIGPSHGQPLRESDPPQPVTPYGESKLRAELVVKNESKGMDWTIVRPSGVYGPGDRESFTLFQAVARGIKPILGDPNRKIQMIYVDDLVRAVSAAVKNFSNSGRTYHLAHPRAQTMRELFDCLDAANAAQTGRHARSLRIPATLLRMLATLSQAIVPRFGQTPMLTPAKARELLGSWEIDTTRAEAELGFRGTTEFQAGAAETFSWYRREGWLRC